MMSTNSENSFPSRYPIRGMLRKTYFIYLSQCPSGDKFKHIIANAAASAVPMINHQLVSANDQALDYDVELSIINQNYVQIIILFIILLQIKSKIYSANVTIMSAIQNNIDI